MAAEKVQKSSSWTPQTQAKTSQFAPPAMNVQAAPASESQMPSYEPLPSDYVHPLMRSLLADQPTQADAAPQQAELTRTNNTSQSAALPVIQTKLTIGAPGDQYEQEADRVAADVVQRINAPASPFDPGQEASNPAQKPQVQAKLDLNLLQRQDQPEEEERLQAKSLLQRREALGVGEASIDLEGAIQSARGGGQPLDAGLQQSIGQAMGADFSGVKVHTDSQADTLNRSIQAKAFTTGQDLFFRQGEYNPGSRAGQELIAHELTHVVQQNHNTIQREAVKDLTPEEKKQIEEEGGAIQAKFEQLPQLQRSVIQRAYTARRPLGGKLSFGDMTNRWIKNKGVFHEHIFFEDGQDPLNLGFMGHDNETGSETDAELLSKYVKVVTGLDDPRMRKAVTKVGNPGAYSLLGNNCQAYVAKVLAAYEAISQDKSTN